MKKIKLHIVFAIMFLAISACERENDKNPMLIGKWQGVEWLAFGKPSGNDANQVHFEFKADGNYTAGFGSQQESGTWRTVNDKLYTTASDRKEIMVKILELDSTVLKFEMNRGGQQETMKLNRVQ